MTHQRIRLRSDIFQSQEFALMEERTVGIPLILPEPVPSIRNEMFNQINEPEVICLGNGKDLNCDYNDNHSSKDPYYPVVKDFQGQIIEDEQSLEGVKRTLDNNCIDFVNGSYSCSVCHIEIRINNIESHLQGKQHAKLAEGPAEMAEKNQEKMLKKKLKRKLKKKQKLAAENEISSSEFILIKELKSGKVLRVCILCDLKLKSECESREHLRGPKHKATYERYSK